MNPAFSQHNDQPKGVFRWYGSFNKREQEKAHCADVYASCPPKLITPTDSLLPFQVARPRSVLGITSWKIYDLNGTEVYDLVDDRDKLLIEQYQEYDTITYNGDVLGLNMATGHYYSIIVTDGVEYYSENFFVQCSSYSANKWPSDPFTATFDNEADSTPLFLVDSDSYYLSGVISTPGAPTNPAWAFNGRKVGNTGDDLIYTYSGGWTSSTPSSTAYYYNSANGTWYRYDGANLALDTNPPIGINPGTGIYWVPGSFSTGTPSIVAKLELGFGDQEVCLEQYVQVELTFSDITQGSIRLSWDTMDAPVDITTNGTHTISVLMNNGTQIAMGANSLFNGELTSFVVRCPLRLEDCLMKLSWTSCGNVGNLSHNEGFTQEYFIDSNSIQPRATTRLLIDEEVGDDGDVTEVSRRKEVTYEVFLGAIPWTVADALTEACLHDTVRIQTPNFSTYDTLVRPRVTFDPDDNFSKCLVLANLTYQIDNTSVACCEEFDPPCSEPCIDAWGFVEDPDPQENGFYLSGNAPYYSLYETASFQQNTLCREGIANIVDVADGSIILRTVVWNVNDGEWQDVATNTLATTEDPAECTVTLRFTVLPGYRAVLQYRGVDGEWTEDTSGDFDLSPLEWTNNTQVFTFQDDQTDTEVRLRVYVGGCTVGYSEAVQYACD